MRNINPTKVFSSLLILFVSFFLSIGNVYAATGDWPSYFHDAQNTGYNSSSTIAPTLLKVWQQNLGGRVDGQVVANNVVYATVEGSPYTIKAVNANTGAMIWSFQGDSGRSLSSPAVDNNTVFVVETPPGNNCTNYGYMIALNASNGSVLWKDQTTGSYTMPAVANGNLYVNSNGCNNAGIAEAINESDGSVLWTASVVGGPVAQPAVNGSAVFIGTPCGCGSTPDFYALNINTGATLWTYLAGGQYGGNVYTQPVVSGSTVYTAGSGGSLTALDTTSGSVQWLQNFITNTAPQTDGTNLYLGQSQTVDARNPSNGNLLWSYTMPGTSNGSVNVVVANGNVYATGPTDGGLVALNTNTGSVSGTFISPSGTSFNKPAITSSDVFVGDSAGNLYDLNNVGPIAVQIVTSPTSGTEAAGNPFSVDVKITDTVGKPFNAAAADVVVSSNLTVTGLNYPTTNSCNFNYTKRPSTSDPSFAGAIFGSSSSGCTVYTLTLTPNAQGTGTITFNNGSVKAFTDNSEILTDVANGSYTINAATPTPTPPGTNLVTIDDSVQGTSQNQWDYVGGWQHCTDTSNPACNPNLYNNSVSWDNTTNDTATITFTGRQIKLYGLTDPNHGIAGVSIDGGSETNVDFYSATRTGDVLLWTSPILSDGQHTMEVRVTGNKNVNSGGAWLAIDRADIVATTPSNLSVTNNVLVTYGPNYTITGTKDSSIITVYVNGSSANTTYPTSTTWQAIVPVSLGNNNFTVYGTDANNNQTSSIAFTVNRHTLGDINGDGKIDLTDASIFASDYGKTDPSTFNNPLSDLNGDGKVDLTDFSILAKLEQ